MGQYYSFLTEIVAIFVARIKYFEIVKKIFMLVSAAVMLLVSCGEDIEKKAGSLVEEARTAYVAQDYIAAKRLLDSVRTCYPKAFKARRAALQLRRDVELDEQRRSVDYYNEALALLTARRDSMLAAFVLEKDKKYQDVGNYMIPSQTVKNNLGNTYLRAQVDENGVATITSVYRGKAIAHKGVKVSSGDNYAECSSPFNDYSSKHLGVTIERLDFRYGQDGGIMDFIASYNTPIKVELKGNVTHKYTLRNSDADAIADVLELAKVLQAISSTKEMRDEAERHIRFVQQSREKFDSSDEAM